MQVEVSPKANTRTTQEAASHESLAMPAIPRESSLNPLAPFRTFRSLAGCVGLSVMGMFSSATQAATQNLPWRAQWGHPTHVTVTGQGQTHVMTYKQFFEWVGKGKHPNERGIKVVGTLPANVAAERAAGTPHTAHGPQGQGATSQSRTTPPAPNYAAWAKYQKDLQLYHKQMADYQAKLAAWHQAQANTPITPGRANYQQRPAGLVQEGTLAAAVVGVSKSVWKGVQTIGKDIKQSVKNAQYTPPQFAAAQTKAPKTVTYQKAAPPSQQAAAIKASPVQAPQNAPQSLVAAKPLVNKPQQAAPAPEPAPKPAAQPQPASAAPPAADYPEPVLPTFDLSQTSAGPSSPVLPRLGDTAPVEE